MAFKNQRVTVDANGYHEAYRKAARHFIDKFGLTLAPYRLVPLLRAHRNGAQTFVSSPVPNFTDVPEEDKQWLVGFIEGDGSIIPAGTGTNGPRITIYQKDIRLPQFIQGLISGGVLRNSIASNGECTLMFNGWKRCRPILNVIRNYVVAGYTLSRMEGAFGVQEEGHKPTLPWVCGFWDAEGHFGCSYGPSGDVTTFSVSQKDRTVLEKVRNLIGGRIHKSIDDTHSLSLRRGEIETFVPNYLRYSHNLEKREELLAILYYMATNHSGWIPLYSKVRRIRR